MRMDYLSKGARVRLMKQEQMIKLQIIQQLRLEQSLKKNYAEEKIVKNRVAYLTRKLDEILEYKMK